MLHFLILKTSLDSLGLGFLECEPEVSRYARLRLGARPPSIAVSSATTAQHSRPVAHLLLGYCVTVANVSHGTILQLSHRADCVNGS